MQVQSVADLMANHLLLPFGSDGSSRIHRNSVAPIGQLPEENLIAVQSRLSGSSDQQPWFECDP